MSGVHEDNPHCIALNLTKEKTVTIVGGGVVAPASQQNTLAETMLSDMQVQVGIKDVEGDDGSI